MSEEYFWLWACLGIPVVISIAHIAISLYHISCVIEDYLNFLRYIDR